jgi:hypothetical protein
MDETSALRLKVFDRNKVGNSPRTPSQEVIDACEAARLLRANPPATSCGFSAGDVAKLSVHVGRLLHERGQIDFPAAQHRWPMVTELAVIALRFLSLREVLGYDGPRPAVDSDDAGAYIAMHGWRGMIRLRLCADKADQTALQVEKMAENDKGELTAYMHTKFIATSPSPELVAAVTAELASEGTEPSRSAIRNAVCRRDTLTDIEGRVVSFKVAREQLAGSVTRHCGLKVRHQPVP